MSDVLKQNKDVKLEMSKDSATIEKAEEEADVDTDDRPKEPSGKLILAEEIALGHVGWQACKRHLQQLRVTSTRSDFA